MYLNHYLQKKKNIIKVFNIDGNKTTREYNTHGMIGFYINFQRKYGTQEKYPHMLNICLGPHMLNMCLTCVKHMFIITCV